MPRGGRQNDTEVNLLEGGRPASPCRERRHVSLVEIEPPLRRLPLGWVVDSPWTLRRGSSAVVDEKHLGRAEEMARFVAQKYTEPLAAGMIGRYVGPHPSWAMALFQRTSGPTLVN